MNFAGSAALQFRSIKALLLQRIRTRYVGSRAGYLWAFVEPIAWVFVLKFAFGGKHSSPPIGDSFEVFFVTGLMIARGARTASSTIAASMAKSKRLPLPAMHKMDATYAVWLLEFITTGIVLTIILSVLGIAGFDAMPYDPLICILAFATASLFALAFGMIYAVTAYVIPALTHFRSIVMMILLLTSGFMMLMDRIPPQLRAVLWWNPLFHIIEWFREGFYRGYECVNLSKEYVFTFIVLGLLFGLTGERAMRRRNERT